MPADKSPIQARSPRGFADRSAADIRATESMMATIRRVYERYGFEPVETPLVEYTETLGKFLPDQDRPGEGVFSFKDDGEQEARSAGGATGKQGNSEWLSLRYDLTAPLARYVAENWERLPKPYRSYRYGWVFRNEKPGPGRFRQFMQFDADTVGSASPAADAEMCMMMADTMEALGIPRGQYVIKVNSRKVLDGLLEEIGLGGDANVARRLTIFRAIDKWDRLGSDAVRDLLGRGRQDESGDFTFGARLDESAVHTIMSFVFGSDWRNGVPETDIVQAFVHNDLVSGGINDLMTISKLTSAAGYRGRVRLDPSVVRGLEYYTGAVFEAELLAEIPNEKGQPVVFGSVGGGGRYDGLVGRFMAEDVPATGFSIGVSRLQAALAALGKLGDAAAAGPVVVLVMDRERTGDYQKIVADLRNADIPAELYLGAAGMKAQMKYADRRNAPLAVIQGGSEVTNPDGTPRAPRVVQIKDLAAGKAASRAIAGHAEWREERPGQVEVPETELVAAVKRMLGRA